MTNDQIGMLLVGHGTRDEQGVAEFLQTVAMVAELEPNVTVEPGFLELAEPSIAQALERLAGRDVREIIVVPLLLFAAGHAKQDIPRQVSIAAARLPHIKIRQAEPLGGHEEILAVSAARFLETLGRTMADVTDDVALVIVSRGTSDVVAIASVCCFVEARCKLTSVAEVHTGFVAAAEPPIDDVLRSVQASDCETIVVQPHLLFHGQLILDLEEKVDEAQAAARNKRFLLARYIGPCRGVAVAAVDRFRAVCGRCGV